MTNNPYAKIKQNSIMTASPQELTLMLYNGAIKFANQAVQAINDGNIQLAHAKIIRVEDIIQEFRLTLDFEYEVSKDMDLMYEYMNHRLVEANIKKDTEIVDEVIVLLREFRDMWKEMINITKNAKTPNVNELELVAKQAQ